MSGLSVTITTQVKTGSEQLRERSRILRRVYIYIFAMSTHPLSIPIEEALARPAPALQLQTIYILAMSTQHE
jgi:hypothetical protein